VVNNDGGGIFSFLPLAKHADAFERLFGTPHGLDVERAAALYGLPYARAATPEDLRARAAIALAANRSEIIEVRTDRAENLAAHRALADAAIRAVDSGP
jgi:2-succinyl-5-enolpyruvyl-6-hydroxy-3-cyclohexene-1-carboxylate synthase